jgi:hypothetical protein
MRDAFVCAVTVSALLLAAAAPAVAHGKKRESGWRGGPPVYGYDVGYGYGYGWRNRDYYGRDRYRHRDGNSDEVILGIGLGILGLSLLADARRDRDDWDDDRRPLPPPDGPWASPNAPWASAGPAPKRPACETPREYTMTVDIGGQPTQVYGSACRQADGSWRMGPIEGTVAGR